MTDVWTEEQVTDFKAWATDGFSMSQVADKLYWKYGIRYSRNACCGKAFRLGLKLKEHYQPPETQKKVKRRAAPKPRVKFEPIISAPVVPRVAPEHVEQFKCETIVPKNIVLFDLEGWHCRWPDGEGAEITFCGHQKFGESSYCPHHYFLSLGPGSLSEQAALRGLRRVS